MMVSSMLAKTNFEICAMAENSAEAVALYAKTKPDVVTMDMNLPDADGIECTRRIHAIDPKAKIVMISAMKDAKLIMQGRMAGIGSFLQKPVSTNELIDTLMIMCNENVLWLQVSMNNALTVQITHCIRQFISYTTTFISTGITT